MPPVRSPCQRLRLQQQSLDAVTHCLLRSLSQRLLTDTELETVVRYLKAALPITQHELVLKVLSLRNRCTCHGRGQKLRFGRRGARSHKARCSLHYCQNPSYICNRSRLALVFGETELSFDYNRDTSKMMSMWDFQEYKKVKIKLPPSYGNESFDYSVTESVTTFTHNLLNYVCTMTNVVHLAITVCPPKLLALVSRSCPSLETLILSQVLEGEANIVGLCGYRPKKLTKADVACGSLHQASKTVCTRLQVLKLGNSEVSLDCVALLLKVFPELRSLKLRQSCSLVDALVRIYGTDSSRYHRIRQTYKLRNVTETYPCSEHYWSLLAQVCPDLSSITMKLGCSSRYNKNVLAELQTLKHLSCLKLFSVCMDSLLWFLEKSGHCLKHLTVTNSYPATDTHDSFHLSHLQQLAECCPNLVTLNLSPSSIRLVRDTDSYETDGAQFQNLKYLQLNFPENSLLELTDIQFLISSQSLKFVFFRNLLPLSDEDCEALLQSPLFRTVETFFHGGLIAGTDNLDKFLEACPQLEHTQLVTGSPAANERIRNRIIQNNWLLDGRGTLYTCQDCLEKEIYL